MQNDKTRRDTLAGVCVAACIALIPSFGFAQQTPAQAMYGAKIAIEQAVKSGAEIDAADDLTIARSWLTQASNANSFFNNLVSNLQQPEAKKAREEEITFLATMATLKAGIADSKTKKVAIVAATKKVQQDLSLFQNAFALAKAGQNEASKAKAELGKSQAEMEKVQAELGRLQSERTALERKRTEEAQAGQAEIVRMKGDLAKASADLRGLEARRIVDAAKTCVELEFKDGSEAHAGCVRRLAP